MGIIRLRYILMAEAVNVVIEILSGCMRGYGHSLVPALISVVGICGVRIIWSLTAFRANPDFHVLMTAYPLSWCVTAAALAVAYFWVKTHHLKSFLTSTKA